MPWTYSGDPAANDKDEVRFLIGDTNVDDQLMSDEELNYLIAVEVDAGSSYSNYGAAAAACDVLAAKYAKLIDKSVGSLSISYSQKYQHFIEIARHLRERASQLSGTGKPPVPELGGGGVTYLGGTWR
jgi:hypothetical protein